MYYSPSGSSVHGILQARILEWAAISFSRGSSQSRDQTYLSCIVGGFFTTGPPGKPINKTTVDQLLSHVQVSEIPVTVVRQAPLSMGFSRQGYWSGLPCPPPGDLPNPRIKPTSLISPASAGGFFTTSATWETKRENV